MTSRAVLETAAAYAWPQTEIRPALDQVAASDTPTLAKVHDHGVVKDLEEKLLKVVYASKLEGTEPFYNPTNIVTIIEKIAKRIPHQEAIAQAYYLLCEVAHPNWAGRSIYVTHTKPGRIPGHEQLTISSGHGESRAWNPASLRYGPVLYSCRTRLRKHSDAIIAGEDTGSSAAWPRPRPRHPARLPTLGGSALEMNAS